MANGKPEGEALSVWLPDGLLADLRTLAEHKGHAVEAEVRTALRHHCGRYDTWFYRLRRDKREGRSDG